MVTVLMALLLAGCSAVTDGYEEEPVPEVSHSYVNLTIAVTNNQAPITRGVPLGGEEDNGREAGFDRENAVTGITLLLYQTSDAAGLNTSTNPAIDFVAYYPVSRTTKDNDARIEATYQTGNQLVPHNTIDFTKTYRAIVVANADLTGSITAGTSHLNDLRNMTLSKIYSGDETRPAPSCGNFVMSSEQDQTLNFTTSTNSRDAAGDYYYDLTNQPLVIERMAARIDFWAVNGTYNADKAGYVYDVTGGGSDKFVVTGIMPFNLNNGTNIAETSFGKEYLLKRLTPSLSEVAPQWLASEGPYTTDPAYYYVLDPQTMGKVTAAHPSLTNSLESVKDLSAAAFASSGYYKSIAAMHGVIASGGGYASLEDGSLSGEDVIVAYPMENTLLQESPLYYHATGIAIEGWYYGGGLTDASPKRMVFYGYMRHHGEGTATSYEVNATNDVNALQDASTVMNFGIVRNNIYRVRVSGVDVVKGTLKLKIEEKKWRHVDNPTIYI
jgi:hypothetical protein